MMHLCAKVISCFRVQGPHLGVGTADGEVCVVDAGSLQCLCRLEAHGMPVTKVMPQSLHPEP
jgi:hypothetical protein